MKELSEADVRRILRERCEATSQREVAREIGVSEVFIHKVVKCNDPIGTAIPEALGLMRVVKYIPCGKGRNRA